MRAVERAVVISDLHLTPADPAGIDRFEALARRLPGSADELLILGDLFDAYVGRKHLTVAWMRPVIRALDLLVGTGVRVTCLHGNRDFLLDGAFERATGARVAGDEDSFTSGGKRFLLVHGDLFCVLDVRYQAMRRKLRTPLVRAAARTLPLSVSLRIAGGLRAKSRAEIAAKAPAEMGIVDSVVEARLAEGFDVVICGHVHDPRTTALAKGTLVVLPAWPDAPGTLRIARGETRFEPAA